jgi:hypothetical protein
MNERTTLEVIAPTVEEAIAQGLEQLGLTADGSVLKCWMRATKASSAWASLRCASV